MTILAGNIPMSAIHPDKPSGCIVASVEETIVFSASSTAQFEQPKTSPFPSGKYDRISIAD